MGNREKGRDGKSLTKSVQVEVNKGKAWWESREGVKARVGKGDV